MNRSVLLIFLFYYLKFNSYPDNLKLKKYSFSINFGINFIDFFNDMKQMFNFYNFKMNETYSYTKRFKLNSDFNVKINNKFDYYFNIGFGFGSCSNDKNTYFILFLDIFPLGFFYNLNKKLSTGIQIGYNLLLNPKNNCKELFYLNLKDIVLAINIFRYNSVINVTLSKEIQIFNIVKRRFNSVFFYGWNIKIGYLP